MIICKGQYQQQNNNLNSNNYNTRGYMGGVTRVIGVTRTKGGERGKEGGEEIFAQGWAGKSKVVPEGPRGLKNERNYKHRQK